MPTKSFLPPFLPLRAADDAWGQFEPLASEATANLGILNGMMEASAKADLFWLSWLMREAQSSNWIEGTITTLDEVFGENIGAPVPRERKDEVAEVLNYREAMLEGLHAIGAGQPLGMSLIRALHARLLRGARGETKHPGEVRPGPVVIGNPPRYWPPSPEQLPPLLENLEAFMQRKDMNPVIQTAILHGQFEMIHPFLDGNGRMGRLLITLFLARRNLVGKPCFFLSAYLQNRRQEYYDTLDDISRKSDWKSWIEFFLRAVVEKSQGNIGLLRAMTALYEESKGTFTAATGSTHAVEILDYVFRTPVFTLPDLRKNSGIRLGTAALTNLLGKLHDACIITLLRPKSGRRAATWRFDALINLIEA
ncbi:MAG: Fic family protein [Desulfovibrio sp.]|nr:Fic family protein [Desulfovibrio sp.]